MKKLSDDNKIIAWYNVINQPISVGRQAGKHSQNKHFGNMEPGGSRAFMLLSLERHKVKDNNKNNEYIVLTTARENYKNNFFLHNDINAQKEYIERNRETDTYRTINQFKEPTNKSKENVGFLVSLALDVEASNHAFDITKEDAIKLVDHIKKEFGVTIPEPSKINHSGRGLHIYFDIEPTTDKEKYMIILEVLQKLVDNLIGTYDALSEARHDPTINYWSLIRVENTKNTKAGVYVSNLYRSAALYTLDNLISEYFEKLNHIKGNNQKAIHKEYQKHFKMFKRVFKGYNKSFTVDTLRNAVISDLQALQCMRNDNLIKVQDTYKLIGNEGTRNNMLFYYGLYKSYVLNDTKALYEAMSAFNDNFKPQPLTKIELEATYKSIISNNYATPSNSTMIKNIGIDQNEMQQLKAIIDIEEKRRRKVISVTEYKAAKRQQRATEKQELINEVTNLYNQGISTRELAETYKISQKTIYNYINKNTQSNDC